MTRRPRRKHASAFRAKVAMTAVKGEKTPAELAQQFDIHVNRITQWKAQLLDGAAGGVQPETPALLAEHRPARQSRLPPRLPRRTRRSRDNRRAASG
jgi:transposase-like protein